MKSFVYVISGDHGRQKIGSSDNPSQRIKELQTGSPFPLKFEFIGEAENGSGGQIEVEAHFMLNSHKAPGGDEWFVVPSDVAVTAVMAAAHRLGYRCKPVDVDDVRSPSYDTDAPSWHWVVHGLAAIPLLLACGWLLWSYDQDRIGGVALVVCGAIAIGLFKLLRYTMIRFGTSLIRFGRVLHPADGA